MADFRQILTQGRKRLGLVVGAGAPSSLRVDKNTGQLSATGVPLIPTVATLTKTVLGRLSEDDRKIIQKIIAAVGSDPNIEQILSRVRLLSRAIGLAKVYDLDGPGYEQLGEKICREIGLQVGPKLPPSPNAFTELVAWVSGTSREQAVEIFTTNYDLLLEEAFERARVPYFDGFSGGNAPFFDPTSVASNDLPARWARLWKLHGSLGWAIEDGNIVRGRGRGASQLIYPDHLKYDHIQKLPYAALFERLRQFLLTPDTLLIACGFSFADAHVCALLEEALAANANTAVFAFQYRELNSEASACAIARNRPNFSVYAEDGAVIRGVPGPWHIGELPNKDWAEIRNTFWAAREPDAPHIFTLGDFSQLARFFALAQASQLMASPPQEPTDEETAPTAQAGTQTSKDVPATIPSN